MTPRYTKTCTTSRWTLSHGLDYTQTAHQRDYKCTSYVSAQSRTQMTKKEIIEDLCHKVADIKYDLQVVLDTLYQLDNEDNE